MYIELLIYGWQVLSFVFPYHYLEEKTLEMLIQILDYVEDDLEPQVLTALTFVGKAKPIGKLIDH